MKPITVIEYDGRSTLTITGPEKMKSYMTVMPEFAHLMRKALEALGRSAPDTHVLIRDALSPSGWRYKAYFGD